MDRTQKIILGLLVVAAVGVVVVFSGMIPKAAPVATPVFTVYFFYGEECPHCHNVLPFIHSLQQKYPDVDFQLLETWHNQTNFNLSVSLNQKLGIQKWGVPEVIVGNVTLMGDVDIPDKLESVILDQKKKS